MLISQHVLLQPLIMRCASADTDMAAEVEPSMDTEERLAAEAAAAALRQVRTRSSSRTCIAWVEGTESCHLCRVVLLTLPSSASQWAAGSCMATG